MDIIIDKFKVSHELISKLKKEKYNIIFINADNNIFLNDTEWIDTLSEIKSIDKNVQLNFFSMKNKYIFHESDIEVFGDLVTSISKEVEKIDKKIIEKKLLKALNQRNKHKKSFFLICNKDKLRILNIDDIVFFKSNNKAITVVTKDEEIDFYSKIKNLEEIFNENLFIRCHRGFLINPEYVKEITKEFIYLDYDYKVPLSRLRASNVRNIFNSYLYNNEKSMITM